QPGLATGKVGQAKGVTVPLAHDLQEDVAALLFAIGVLDNIHTRFADSQNHAVHDGFGSTQRREYFTEFFPHMAQLLRLGGELEFENGRGLVRCLMLFREVSATSSGAGIKTASRRDVSSASDCCRGHVAVFLDQGLLTPWLIRLSQDS